jgi:hypothetical protein
MDDYQEATPDDLWSRIESSLPEPQAEKKSKVVPLYWKRWTAAAAIIAVLAGGYTYLKYNSANLVDVNTQMAQKTDSSLDTKDNANTNGNNSLTSKTLQEKSSETSQTSESSDVIRKYPSDLVRESKGTTGNYLTHNSSKVSTADSKTTTQTDTHDSILPSTNKTTEQADKNAKLTSENNTTSDNSKQHENITNRNADKRNTNNGLQNPYEDEDFFYKRRHKKHSMKVNVGLYALNGLASKNYGESVMMSNDMLKLYNKHGISSRSSLSATSGTTLIGFSEGTHHKAPVSFGLSVGIPFNDKLTLTSGLVYTHLYSEYSRLIITDNFSSEQKLDYVGIPLSLNYAIWNNKKIKTYIAAGAQIDMNVNATIETNGTKTDIEKDAMQVSGLLNAGLQYNIIPQAGVYIEPGLRYYFDNHSEVENYFKEKKLNFNLQVGFRYNFQ